MYLPMEAWQEDSLETGPQDLPPGYDPQVAPRGTTEENAPAQGIEDSSDNPSPSNGEVYHHLGRIHQVNHSNSAQNLT